jgi:hypothetical protein
MDNLLIDCVWCTSRREFNKFIKDIKGDQTHIIDHIAIRNKLVKADPYEKIPNESIIGLTIFNEIKRCLRPETSNVNHIVYLFKTLDSDIIFNFKKLIESSHEHEFLIRLTTINYNDVVSDKIVKLFDSINIIKND